MELRQNIINSNLPNADKEKLLKFLDMKDFEKFIYYLIELLKVSAAAAQIIEALKN